MSLLFDINRPRIKEILVSKLSFLATVSCKIVVFRLFFGKQRKHPIYSVKLSFELILISQPLPPPTHTPPPQPNKIIPGEMCVVGGSDQALFF